MRSTSTDLLLLGIALLLFGMAFSTTVVHLFLPYIPPGLAVSATAGYLLESIFPVAGLVVAFVGFFRRRNS